MDHIEASALHRYAPHPDGDWCDICGLPVTNARHTSEPDLLDARTPVTPVAANAPVTSIEAAARARPSAGSLRAHLITLIAESPGGLTDDDLEAITRRKHQTVSAARNALVADGWLTQAVDPAGEPITRPTRTGHDATVWTLTVAAREALAA